MSDPSYRDQCAGAEGVAKTDSIVVIRSRYRRLAKTVYADNTILDYDKARIFDLFEIFLPDFAALGKLLVRLMPRSDCAVVFGAIVDPSRITGVRRLAYPDPDTNDQPTLRAVPHRWCALDFDYLKRPETIPATDIVACAGAAIEQLPEVFHGVTCFIQATGGHGIKPGSRLRLWFWLNRPATGDELGFWLKGRPVDPCTFRPASPIYTAAPVLVGRQEHLACRFAEIAGKPTVSVPSPEALNPSPRPIHDARRNCDSATYDDVAHLIDVALARVRRAPDGRKHHELRNAARLLGGVQNQAGFSDREAVRWLLDALPQSARDLNAAMKTALWGLDVGRQKPISPRSRKSTQPNPRKQETARTAFRLLRQNVPSDALLAEMHERNNRRAKPLPPEEVVDIACWAAARILGPSHV